jgi:hypothetical protein
LNLSAFELFRPKAGLQKQSLSLCIPSIVSDNGLIASIVLSFALILYAVHALFGIHNKIAWIFYFDDFTRLAVIYSGIFLIPCVLNKSYKIYFSLRYIAGFLTVFLLAPLFTCAFVSFKQTIPLIRDFCFDVPLMRLDRWLHFGHDPWRLLSPILAHPWIVRGMDILYIVWFLVLVAVSVWMAWTRRRRLRLCFFISMLLIWTLLGIGMGILFSSAGPCYLSKVVRTQEDPFAPLMSRLNEIGKSTSLWALENQAGLWQTHETGTWSMFAGISAMPSIHLAIATAFVLLGFEVRRWLGVLFLVYLGILQIGSVILGWHYAVDGYAGIILACLIWYVVRRLIRRMLPPDMQDPIFPDPEISTSHR